MFYVQVYLSNFEQAPNTEIMNDPEIQKQILLKSDYTQIPILSRISKSFWNICFGSESKSFWKDKLQEDFPNCNNPVLLNMCPKKAYKFLILQKYDKQLECEESEIKFLENDIKAPAAKYEKSQFIQKKESWVVHNECISYKILLDKYGQLFVQETDTDCNDELMDIGEPEHVALPPGVGPVIEIMETMGDEDKYVCFIDINRRFYEIHIDTHRSIVTLTVCTQGEISSISKLDNFESFIGKGRIFSTLKEFNLHQPKEYKIGEKDFLGNCLVKYCHNGKEYEFWTFLIKDSFSGALGAKIYSYKAT